MSNTHIKGFDSKEIREFCIDKYLDKLEMRSRQVSLFDLGNITQNEHFKLLCKKIKEYIREEFDKEYTQSADIDRAKLLLKRQKKAIMGCSKEVNYFKDKINEYLSKYNLFHEVYPKYYTNLVEAIYHECWGLSGLAEWMDMPESTGAKIIGSRIFFLENGKKVLKKQSISLERFSQLRKALFLNNPDKMFSENYSEVYLHSGERISMYYGSLVKSGQPVMAFRKYIIKNLSFEEQARRNTIPKEAIQLFKAWACVGFNVAFIGAPSTGKSTFLTTWQRHEKPFLEGISIETDPEIPWHNIMPETPIIQLIANKNAKEIASMVLRGDPDYVIIPEARDGEMFNLVIDMANRGMIRNKITCHFTFVEDFPYDVANKIHSFIGGNLDYHIIKVAKSFHYIFEFIQLKDKSKKRLSSIHEMRYEREKSRISFYPILRYDHLKDNWKFNYEIGKDKERLGTIEDNDAFKIFRYELKRLSEKYPMEEEERRPIVPFYGGGR